MCKAREKKKNKGGRPTKFTEMTLKKLEEAFALGCTDDEACFYADMSKKTLYNYQAKNPEFVHRKEALKARPILIARESVIEHMKEDGNLALKYLERKRKEEFAPPKQSINIEGVVGHRFICNPGKDPYNKD